MIPRLYIVCIGLVGGRDWYCESNSYKLSAGMVNAVLCCFSDKILGRV